jgi:hypothetical protein
MSDEFFTHIPLTYRYNVGVHVHVHCIYYVHVHNSVHCVLWAKGKSTKKIDSVDFCRFPPSLTEPGPFRESTATQRFSQEGMSVSVFLEYIIRNLYKISTSWLRRNSIFG